MNMNGQYLMNKQVSVQYAYKKDGKGERHGDQAERTLAAQARKHNIRPATQPSFTHQQFAGTRMIKPPTSAAAGATVVPTTMVNGAAAAEFSNVDHSIPYQNMGNRPMPPPPPPMNPLVSASPGLPARPPPSQAGYGGPQAFLPQGFNQSPLVPQGASGFGTPPLRSGFQPGFARGR